MLLEITLGVALVISEREMKARICPMVPKLQCDQTMEQKVA